MKETYTANKLSTDAYAFDVTCPENFNAHILHFVVAKVLQKAHDLVMRFYQRRDKNKPGSKTRIFNAIKLCGHVFSALKNAGY